MKIPRALSEVNSTQRSNLFQQNDASFHLQLNATQLSYDFSLSAALLYFNSSLRFQGFKMFIRECTLWQWESLTCCTSLPKWAITSRIIWFGSCIRVKRMSVGHVMAPQGHGTSTPHRGERIVWAHLQGHRLVLSNDQLPIEISPFLLVFSNRIHPSATYSLLSQ